MVRKAIDISTHVTRRAVLRSSLALCVAGMVPSTVRGDARQWRPRPGIPLPFEMPGYREPTFADRTFDITDFGAESGGEAMNTQAIARAIAACHEAGGGRVLVPTGVWLTGPVHFQSNVELHLGHGAELRFSRNFEDYLPVVYTQRAGVRCYNYSPFIYARDCRNVALTGSGILNGQAQHWWRWRRAGQPGMMRLLEMNAAQTPVKERVFGRVEDGVRPPFIQFLDCRDVLIDGVTVIHGPSWQIHPVTCENVTVRDVTIDSNGPNNDGIDPDGCRNVVIEDCLFRTGDDAIAIKAGRDHDGWAVGKPCENIVIRRCICRRDSGGMAIGTEMSAGVRNVLVHDCYYENSSRIFRFKSRPGRGGVVENVWLQNLTARHIHHRRWPGQRGAAVYFNMEGESIPGFDPTTTAMPVFRNIHIRDIDADHVDAGVIMMGHPDHDCIHDITVQRVTVRNCIEGADIRHVRDVRLKHINMTSQRSPLYRVRDSRDVTIENVDAPAGTDVFLRVDGPNSKAIALQKVDTSKAQRRTALGDDVPTDAVSDFP